jgi:hypothetical protein
MEMVSRYLVIQAGAVWNVEIAAEESMGFTWSAARAGEEIVVESRAALLATEDTALAQAVAYIRRSAGSAP